jgi:FkbM family methyltransferase
MKSYGQMNQDAILYDKYFKKLTCPGVFVDVGAHDGVSLSNTYMFEKDLGWSGLCFEPIPKVFEELKKARTSKCYQNAVFNKDGEIVQFLCVAGAPEMLSGILDTQHPNHIKRINTEIGLGGGSTSILNIVTITLESALRQNNIDRVNYLSIDTEGSELQVLQGINFDKVFIDVIEVENNYWETFAPVKNFLLSKGFRHEFSIQFDEIFVNPKSSLL